MKLTEEQKIKFRDRKQAEFNICLQLYPADPYSGRWIAADAIASPEVVAWCQDAQAKLVEMGEAKGEVCCFRRDRSGIFLKVSTIFLDEYCASISPEEYSTPSDRQSLPLD